MAKQENNKKNLQLYWGLLRNYKLLIVALLLVILLVQVSYVAERFLFKVIIDKGTAFAEQTITKEILIASLILVGILFGAMVLVRAIMKWFHIHFINILDAKVIFDLKQKFFSHVLHLSYNFHTTHRTGSLISRLVRGGSAVERINGVFVFNAVPLIFQLIAVSLSIVFFDWGAALVVFITVVLFIAYSYYIQIKQHPARIAFNDAEDFEKANISDIFTNIESIKYFGKENIIKSKYHALSSKTKETMLEKWKYYRQLDAVQTLILGLGVFFLIYFPLINFLNNQMTIGTLVFIYTVYGTLTGPLYGFVHGMREYFIAMTDFESLFQYGRIENEVKDEKDAKPLKIKNGKIEFKKVTFKYHERKLFDNFSLVIEKNSKVALVGHSGSGKTTFVKLLYRMYDLHEGRILIDGINIAKVTQESLRNELSIVPQECILFDDTIYNNIAFSNPDATYEQVMQAMKFAQLDSIVQTFPQKEKTIVGERGIKLSGGEKQRVSIARAILADKKILVLDEATSSLDSKTEHGIQSDLKKLMENRTSIIIAHRLSTIMHANKIVVFDSGRIVQMGTHEELIKQKGTYKQLWNLQKGGYIE